MKKIMTQKRHYCVISHTHWDREWYQTQEEFRMRLIDLFDHLLEILDKEPEYIFHMDAQTVVFEDYWEVRPEMKEKCCQYIREGRILAGPWYVQNDFFLTSGESTVRNLLIGMKQAEEMGGCARTGYTPDQFGLISQLPQILRGFELDHCVFGRGYCDFEKDENGDLVKDETGMPVRKNKPAEFMWKSPDGSEVLAICMSYWYNNAQRFSADIDRAYRLTKNIEESFEGVATTPYLLLMNGVDHLEPQPDLLPILKGVDKRLGEEEKIYQTTLEHYAELVRSATPAEAMATQTGELMEGNGTLKDTASSRVYLKQKNAELQNMLENSLEPLYTYLELNGMKGIYPSGHLDYLWKMLIRNHAHDSICGCSTDWVHRHMEDRFAAISEMGRELKRRGMKQLAAHVTEGTGQDDYLIIVFNALEQSRTEVVDVTVDIVAADEPAGLKITSPNGEDVPFTVLKEYTVGKSVFPAINLPGTVDTRRYEIRLLADNVPAMGYTAYRVETKEKPVVSRTKAESGENIVTVVSAEEETIYLENKWLKAEVLPSGKIQLCHKESGHCYTDIVTVQDVADLGNVYDFVPLADDVPVDIAELKPEITVEETDAFVGRVRLHYEVTVPAYYDAAKGKRSEQTVTMPLDIYVGLKAPDKYLELNFKLDNRARDHRMRALIRSGYHTDISTASAPYDLIARNKWDIDTRICTETEHTSGCVTVTGDKTGLSVLNCGVYGFENLQKEQGTLAFTLVRANDVINGGAMSDDEAWKVPENQCQRELECKLAVLPQCGEAPAMEAAIAAKAFQNPLMAQCEPVDLHKFMGGRPAVQDTSIAELFYQELEYADVELAREDSGFLLEGENLQVTAWKKSQDRTGYILRFYNMSDEAAEAVVHLGNISVTKAWKTNLKESAREELQLAEHTISLPVRGKEIVTLYMI